MAFFEDEFQDLEEAQDESVEPTAEQTVEDDEDDLDEQLQDVERRLEVASLYRMFLENKQLFQEDSVAARTVTKRFRSFARKELSRLFGLEQEAPVQQVVEVFSSQEITALKAWAAKLVGGGTRPLIQTSPPASQIVPIASPKTMQPIAQPKKPVKQQAKPPEKKKPQAPQQPVKRVREGEVLKESTVKDAKGNEEEGKGTRVRVKRVRNRMVKEFIDADGRVIDRRDVTPQVAPPTAIPMPQAGALTAVTHQQATAAVLQRGLDPTINQMDQ